MVFVTKWWCSFLQVKAWLEDGKDVRLGDWKAADIEILNTFQLLTAKPVVYLVSCVLHDNRIIINGPG